jgi:DNA-directed RNA polymerase specialized sigma subunit
MTEPVDTNKPEWIDYRSKDRELFDRWKQTGSKTDLGKLVNQLSGVIYQEVNRQSGSLPSAALSAEAKKWAINGIKTYDPSKGTQLSTHVTNYLQRVRRLNYKYQNAVRLPENMQLLYRDWNSANQELADQLNRDPTEEELAKALGWSKPQVIKYKNSLYSDLVESASDKPAEFTQYNENAELMAYLMSQLSSDEKFIFDNVKEMPAPKIAEKLGVNINRYNYIKKQLINKIEKTKREIGL